MARKRAVKERKVLNGGFYTPLTQEGISQIHETSMDVFEQVGVKIAYKPVLDIWKNS